MNQQEKMKTLETVKEGSFKKVEYQDKWGNSHTAHGIIVKKDDLSLSFYNELGEEVHLIWKDVVRLSTTRSLEKEQKELMKAYYQSNKTFVDLQAKFKEARDSHADLFLNNKERLMKIKGILTNKQFVDSFFHDLPRKLQLAIKQGEYRIEIHGNTQFDGNRSLELIRNILIGKWMAKECSFVYEEYDGCLFLTDRCEKDKNYQKYLKEYRFPLDVKMEKSEELDVGDKRSLWYTCTYRFNLQKDLTQKYAEEVVDKICR